MGCYLQLASLAGENCCIIRRAQIACNTCNGIKHWLKIEPCAADNAQDLAGGRLVLKRLGQLACSRLHLLEQPGVLDGDWSEKVVTSSISLSV